MTSKFIEKFNLNKTALFKGMSIEEIKICLKSLSALDKYYFKGEMVMLSGTSVDSMGLVLSGSITVEINDRQGNKTILSHISKGDFFAESYAFNENEFFAVDVEANEDCHILFLNLRAIKKAPKAPENWLHLFLLNLLTIVTDKNLSLTRRSYHASHKSIRGRVMAYLNSMSLRANSTSFDIPFNRSQLADYLNVERTALSKELKKMQDEGLISYRLNHFSLFPTQP